MKKIAVMLALFAAAGVTLFIFRGPILVFLAERSLNAGAAEYLTAPIRLKRVELDRSFRIRIEGLKGSLKTASGSFPFEVTGIQSQGSLFQVFSKEGAKFDFQNFRPEGSAKQGAEGTLYYRAGKEWFSKLEIRVQELGLEDVRWMEPDSLNGASGSMKGSITFGTDYLDHIQFETEMAFAEPGGYLQERFFEGLKPYLPGLALKPGQLLVGYKEAGVAFKLHGPDDIKGFLHITVPDYNLKLNLNIQVRIDEKNAFSKLFQVMGLIRVQK